MLPAEQCSEIRRLFYGEHWRIGTIAIQFSLHRSTIERALGVDYFGARGAVRPSALDPFYPLVESILAQYPRLTASRIHRMLEDRGYQGSAIQLRRFIRKHQLRPQSYEAFLRWDTLPGEQAQADWAHIGTVRVDGVERSVSAFVMVLSWSRGLWVSFSLDQTLPNVLRGHVEAFAHFGGVPRTILYDNMKTVVLERMGEAIRFHPQFLELRDHYLFSARPCAPYRPNEKGKVERAIRYLRSSFLAGRQLTDLDELRREFAAWRDEISNQRRCRAKRTLSIAEAMAEEKAAMLPLPAEPFPVEFVRAVVARKQPYILFETNAYSIPYTLVGRPLTLRASEERVQIYDAGALVADHLRLWCRDATSEQAEHLEGLVDAKKRGGHAVGQMRLLAQLPAAEALLVRLGEKHVPLVAQVRQLTTLLDLYGHGVLEEAIAVALERDTPHAASVAWIIDKLVTPGKASAPLPDIGRPDVDNLTITQHNLEDYDAL